MAREKAACAAARYSLSECAVLAADTTVVLDEDVMGKPRDHFHGLAMLARLSGRSHSVMTAICLCGEWGVDAELVETRVEFAQLSREVCEAYLATEEPWDKAGAYAIQGLTAQWVRHIDGSYSGVMGLPVFETAELLRWAGLQPTSPRC